MNEKTNRLGTMPIGKLLLSMSVPMMLSFFIQALYNIVDSMFVAKISENALTAVSLAFPIQQLMTAVAVGTGVAVNALVPRYNGHGEPERARKIANNAVFLSCCYVLICLVIGFTLVHPYYLMQTDVTEIVAAGTQYLTIICTVSIGCFFGQNFEKLLLATGNSVLSMASQAAGAVVNIIFDPLLIFGVGPFPQMGVRGAAVATVFGQIIAAIVALTCLYIKEHSIRLDVKQMLPGIETLKQIFSIAIPSMITVGLTSAMSFGMNQVLLLYSTTATAVFGIWLKLQSFSFMPIFGMNNGVITILSYNFGAGKLDRVRQTLNIALKIAIGLMLLLMVVFEFIPALLLHLFSASDTMISIGSIALRIAVISLPFGAFNLICSSSFQALGRSRYTLIITLCRQLIFIVPLAIFFSLFGELTFVWLAIPASELLSAVVALVFRKKVTEIIEM